jgi:hypothetical protein
MSQFDLVVTEIKAQDQIVEANWLTSLIMAPFKALFWGVTFLIKVVAVIAFVAGVGTAVSIGLFGAFVWYVTGKARGKFRSWEEANRSNPKKADQAKQFMRETQDNLSDPRVRSELRSSTKAAEMIHGAYADAGFEDQAAASVIAIACTELPDDGVVTADWQHFFESPIFVGLAFALSVVLGGWGTALTAFLWYMAGIATHKWASASDASRHDKNKTVEAQKSAVKLQRLRNHPKLREALRKSPKAAKIFEDTLSSLSPSK